jgi:hypothetical protein
MQFNDCPRSFHERRVQAQKINKMPQNVEKNKKFAPSSEIQERIQAWHPEEKAQKRKDRECQKYNKRLHCGGSSP